MREKNLLYEVADKRRNVFLMLRKWIKMILYVDTCECLNFFIDISRRTILINSNNFPTLYFEKLFGWHLPVIKILVYCFDYYLILCFIRFCENILLILNFLVYLLSFKKYLLYTLFNIERVLNSVSHHYTFRKNFN
jgi:hypothetical protein